MKSSSSNSAPIPVGRSLNNAGIWPGKEANKINTVCLQSTTHTSSDRVALAHSHPNNKLLSRRSFHLFEAAADSRRGSPAANRPYWLARFSIYFHSRLELCLCMCASQQAKPTKKSTWKRDLNQNSTRRNNGGSYNLKILWPLWLALRRTPHTFYVHWIE